MSVPGTVNYPAALDDIVSLIQAANDVRTTLASTLSAGATSAVLTDASLFPNTGTFSVEDEIIYYAGKSSNTLTGLIRAREGTTDVTHSGGALAEIRITARHHSVLVDAIIAVQARLGVSSPAVSQMKWGG